MVPKHVRYGVQLAIEIRVLIYDEQQAFVDGAQHGVVVVDFDAAENLNVLRTVLIRLYRA